MGEWLIGVYKGQMITATDAERDRIWTNLLSIHKGSGLLGIRRSGLFQTHPERKILRPYFWLLSESAILGCQGDKGLLKRYGLNPEPAAYTYSGLEPIKAYGTVENGRFVIDKKVWKDCIFGLKRLFDPKEDLKPAQRELRILLEKILLDKGLNKNVDDALFQVLKELLKGGVCVLTLKTKEGSVIKDEWCAGVDWHAMGWVRTGTFFKVSLEGTNLILSPCKRGSLYLVGKGVLVGVSENLALGSMSREGAKLERECPVSKLCVKFKKAQWSDKAGYIIYREVSTDLRADMPLGMLKLPDRRTAFETMFQNLGANAERLASERRLKLDGRNLLLDGTIVDYADLKVIDLDERSNIKALTGIQKELHSILYAAALISVAGENALIALGKGKKELEELNTEKSAEIRETYNRFFKCFAGTAGCALKYFRDLEAPTDILDFLGQESS